MYKRLMCLLVVACIAISIVGCGATAPSDSGVSDAKGENPATGGTSAKVSNEKVKFSLWHPYVGADALAKPIETLMGEFREKYPNYDVDEQKIPIDQYRTKLKTQAAAGQLPECFLIWPNAMTKEFAKANLLADIDDFLSKNADWKKEFNESAIDQFTVDGKTYAVGNGITVTSVIYYNKGLFDKHKLAFPKTFSELKAAVIEFKNNGIIPIAHGNKGKWPAQSTVFSLLANRETGSEWLDNVLNKKGAQFTDPEFVKALSDYKELCDLGAFNKDYNTIDNVQMRDYFCKGQAAMMIDGTWALPDLQTKALAEVKSNIEMDILPAFEGGKGDADVMSGVSANGFAISAKADAKQKAAIEDLILSLTGKDAQKLFAEVSQQAPSYKNLVLDEKGADPLFVKLCELIKKHSLVAVYDSALNSEQTEAINTGLQSISVGQKKPEDVAKKMQALVK